MLFACGWRCRGLDIGECVGTRGCALRYRERCHENVMIAYTCRRQVWVGRCNGILAEMWNRSAWFATHVFLARGVCGIAWFEEQILCEPGGCRHVGRRMQL